MNLSSLSHHSPPYSIKYLVPSFTVKAFPSPKTPSPHPSESCPSICSINAFSYFCVTQVPLFSKTSYTSTPQPTLPPVLLFQVSGCNGPYLKNPVQKNSLHCFILRFYFKNILINSLFFHRIS